MPPAAALGMTTILIDEDERPTPLADYVVPDVVAAVEVAKRLGGPAVPTLASKVEALPRDLRRRKRGFSRLGNAVAREQR